MVFVVIPPKQFHRWLLLNSPLLWKVEYYNLGPKGEELFGISGWKHSIFAFALPFFETTIKVLESLVRSGQFIIAMPILWNSLY